MFFLVYLLIEEEKKVRKITKSRFPQLLMFAGISSLVACGGGSEGGNDGLTTDEIAALVKKSTVKIKAAGSLTLPGSEYGSFKTAANWTGSGFFIDSTGYIVTNNHVATGAGELKVQVEGTSLSYNATVISLAECADLAVLKLASGSDFPVLEWYDGEPDVNLKVAAAGFPGDVIDSSKGESQYTYTEGIINTEVRLNDTSWASVEAFNHSADIFGGNSGGPLVELTNGKVIGVNYAGGGQRQLAISGVVSNDLTSRMKNGENIHSIGISGEVVYLFENAQQQQFLAIQQQLPQGVSAQPIGIWVKGIQAAGKASDIGIKPGDIIREVAGVQLYLTGNETQEQQAAKNSMGQYCSVLRSNNPNNATDPDDKGNAFSIEILRLSSGKTCVGEINGKKLGLKEDPTLDDALRVCPILPDSTGGNNTGGGNTGGGNTGGGNTGGQPTDVQEAEPNNNNQQAQSITIPSTVTGSAKQDANESDFVITFSDNTSVQVEDVYSFTLSGTVNLSINLSSNNQADFDLYVGETTSSTIIASSLSEGNGDELLVGPLNAGTYFIYVDAYDTVTSVTDYTLTITQQ